MGVDSTQDPASAHARIPRTARPGGTLVGMPRPQLSPGVYWAKDDHVTTADGAVVRYTVLPADDRRPDAPAVVLLAGFLCADTWWHHLAPALTAAGYRVVLLHYRGIATSTPPSRPGPDAMSVERFATDVLDVLHAAGIERCALVGHSMGGQVMVEVARRIPQRVWAMAAVTATYRSPSMDLYGIGWAVDPVAGILSRLLEGVDDRIGTPLVRTVFGHLPFVPAMRAVRAFGRHAPTDVLASYADHGAALTGSQLTGTLAAMVRHRPDRSVLRDLDIPTVVIAGEHDPFTPVSLATEMADTLPRADLRIVADTTHAAILEAPTEVNRLVLDHLAAVRPDGAAHPRS